MNNPQKRNALSLSMLQSLQKDISYEVGDMNLRVIVIAGIYLYLSKCFQAFCLNLVGILYH